jgi:hypothetical protein
MAARLSGQLIIAKDVAVITSCLIGAVGAESSEAIAQEMCTDWNREPAIEGAALHLSLSGDSLVELIEWTGHPVALKKRNADALRRIRKVTQCSIRSHVLALTAVRPGPRHGGESMALEIDSESNRPVLIGVFEPVHRSRAALLHYLQEASVRFATQVEGWVGAALYCDEDEQEVIEYLQFESMAAVLASQGSPTIQHHQLELLKFGNVAADLYMVKEVFCR